METTIKESNLLYEVKETLDKIKSELSFIKSLKSTANKKIEIVTRKGVRFINISNIMYCKANGNYSIIYIAEEEPIKTCKRLQCLEEQFDAINFIRCHDSYIVNIDFIKDIIGKTNKMLLLIDKTLIPCARRKQSTVKNALKSAFLVINYSLT